MSIRNTIFSVVQDILNIEDDFIDEKSFLADFGLDAMSAVQIVHFMNEKFNVCMKPVEMFSISTISDLIAHVTYLTSQVISNQVPRDLSVLDTTRTSVRNAICQRIQDLSRGTDITINDNTLITDLQLDSLSTSELIHSLSHEFDIRLDWNDMHKYLSLGEFISYSTNLITRKKAFQDNDDRTMVYSEDSDFSLFSGLDQRTIVDLTEKIPLEAWNESNMSEQQMNLIQLLYKKAGQTSPSNQPHAMKESIWFVNRRASAPEKEKKSLFLFIFPGAGSSAHSSYDGFEKLLPSWINPLLVTIPGRDHRLDEPICKDAHDFITEVAIEILKVADGKHFALLGHSMGGYLAYLVSAWMESTLKTRPKMLFVACANDPRVETGDLESSLIFKQMSSAFPWFAENFRNDMPLLKSAQRLSKKIWLAEKLKTPVRAVGGEKDDFVAVSNIYEWEQVSQQKQGFVKNVFSSKRRSFKAHIVEGGDHFCCSPGNFGASDFWRYVAHELEAIRGAN